MTGIFYGSTELLTGKIKIGGADVSEVYYGSTKVWPAGAPPTDLEFDDTFSNTGGTMGILLWTPTPGPGVWSQIGTVSHTDGINVHPGDARSRRNSNNWFQPATSVSWNRADHWVSIEMESSNQYIGGFGRWIDQSNRVELRLTGIAQIQIREVVAGVINDIAVNIAQPTFPAVCAFEFSGNTVGVWVNGTMAASSPVAIDAALATGTNLGATNGNIRSDGSPAMTRFQCGTGALPASFKTL